MSSDSGSVARSFTDLLGTIEAVDTSSYAVDGMRPGHALRPDSVDELQEIVRAAASERLALIPWGGGSQMGLGNPPARYDVAVDLTAIDQVLRYDPDDMTMSVQTGCRLRELNSMLAENRQVLPVDAAYPERATIGGLVATGTSGPRRFGYGPLRDLIIGMTVLMADGMIATAGGQVVKNVTGFDMMRLHHGALGSLGIVLSVNLKVIPKPQSERTVLAAYATLESADQAARAVTASQLGVTSIVVTNPTASAAVDAGTSDSWTVAVRCEAPPSAVVRQGERVADVIRDGSQDVRIEEETERSELHWLGLCQALDQRPDSTDVAVRIGCAPSRLLSLVRGLETTLGDYFVPTRLTLDYGSGLVYGRLESELVQDDELFRICEPLTDTGDHITLLTGPVTLKEQIDVFGRQSAGFSMIESLKTTFDPDKILNPGRYVGRL